MLVQSNCIGNHFLYLSYISLAVKGHRKINVYVTMLNGAYCKRYNQSQCINFWYQLQLIATGYEMGLNTESRAEYENDFYNPIKCKQMILLFNFKACVWKRQRRNRFQKGTIAQ